MSSPAQTGPEVSKEKEKKGFGKMISRMKTVLKRSGEPSKRKSTTAPATAGPLMATATAPALAPAKSEPTEKPTPKPRRLEGTKVSRMQLHEERARKLGDRFGLEIKPSEWHSTGDDALRIEKPIRMRIRRSCCQCNTTFGMSKTCPTNDCKHMRCNTCPRYPPQRTEAEKIASRQRRAELLKKHAENAPIIPDWDFSKKVVLTRPSKTGGQDLVHKRPRQRVRRTCCQCSKLYLAGSKECGGCAHARCTDCPRDPPKKNKYPYGYPGDQPGANSIPQLECPECETPYPHDAVDGTECSKCSRKKDETCPRVKPRKIEPEPDPEVVKRLMLRLQQLSVDA